MRDGPSLDSAGVVWTLSLSHDTHSVRPCIRDRWSPRNRHDGTILMKARSSKRFSMVFWRVLPHIVLIYVYSLHVCIYTHTCARAHTHTHTHRLHQIMNYLSLLVNSANVTHADICFVSYYFTL